MLSPSSKCWSTALSISGVLETSLFNAHRWIALLRLLKRLSGLGTLPQIGVGSGDVDKSRLVFVG